MRRCIAWLGAGLLVTTGLAACDTARPDEPTDPLVVQTSYGDVRGVEQDGVRSWRAIPFAAPPVGDLRWREPLPPDSWPEVRDSSAYSDWCPQSDRFEAKAPSTSEDCLYLNVNRPADEADDLPVMVWIHGGGFNEGSGGQPSFNSPALVERGVVLVSINYRLGRLGFFAHPKIEGDAANFGLLDQVAALEWVEANIERFGGDADNVTIFGESAGGISVNALMSSSRADGLFDRAISQSGLGREQGRPLALARTAGQQMFPDLDADELRALDAREALSPQVNLFAGEVPVLDDVLPVGVAETFAAGEETAVPYVVGTTDLEFPDFTVAQLDTPPETVRATFLGEQRLDALAAYGSEAELALHLVSDALVTEPARLLATAHARQAPTYLYRFAIAAPEQVAAIGGAPHNAEVPYVFDAVSPEKTGLAESPALADVIADYWVAFATAGDPNHADAPTWPLMGDGAFFELTNEGPVAVTDDPWRERLDAVREAYDARP